MKNFINNIKELKNGNAILFFGFYLLFFIAIFLLIRFGGGKNNLNKKYEPGDKGLYDSKKVLLNNYFFDYKIKLDGKNYNYYGKRNGNDEKFKYNSHDYYKNNDSFFMDNGAWVRVENPYKFYEFINHEKSGALLDEAYLISNIEKDNKVVGYLYSVDTNTINRILYGENTDYDEIPNKVILGIDERKNVNKVTFKLDSFCKLKGVCSNSLEIELSYEMFGDVKKIDNPISD